MKLVPALLYFFATPHHGSPSRSGSGARHPEGFVATTTTTMLEASAQNLEENDDDVDDDFSLEAFEKARAAMEASKNAPEEEESPYDGYDFRDAIVEKWGQCYDVDFNRVDSFGFRKLYLNVLPFRLGRRPFRHATELDYLCHLQAVVEILQKYNQLDNILYQMQETQKKPLAGRSPIVAVPLRLDLTTEQVEEILGY